MFSYKFYLFSNGSTVIGPPPNQTEHRTQIQLTNSLNVSKICSFFKSSIRPTQIDDLNHFWNIYTLKQRNYLKIFYQFWYLVSPLLFIISPLLLSSFFYLSCINLFIIIAIIIISIFVVSIWWVGQPVSFCC